MTTQAAPSAEGAEGALDASMGASGTPVAPRRSKTLLVVGVVLLLVAAAGVAYPLWWNHRSTVAGQALLHEPLRSSAARPSRVPVGGGRSAALAVSACQADLPTARSDSRHLAGILEIPAIGLKAPVLQGLDDAVLDVAVGHDAATPWPGARGESVLLAHDVSYFSSIDRLHNGDQIVWIDACHRTVFRVEQSLVTTPGSVLWPPKSGVGLSLVTCWPTNALFWTSQRFVVKAALVARHAGPAVAPPTLALPALSVPAPPALAALGLSLQDNEILLAGLSLAGSPSRSWAQGPAPLDVEATALAAYFATQKSVAAGNESWWRAISLPGTPLPTSWSDASRVATTITVRGDRVVGVTLQSADVTMRLVVVGHHLLVASVATS